MDEKMKKILIGVIAGFVIFILLLALISSCSKKEYTFESLEKQMVNIAKSYYEKNDKELPKEDKDTKTFTLKKMIDDGKIEDLTKLFNNENLKCDGNVTVTNNNGYYLYSPYLNCGKDYKTSYLKDKIIEDSLVENIGSVGLYEVGDQYIMKGEVTNNVIKLGESLYYIMRINDDGTIKVVADKRLTTIDWDDRYNEDLDNYNGKNEYYLNNKIDSRLKENLAKHYNDKEVWPDTIKPIITTQTLCVGKRAKEDTTLDGSTECAIKLENQLFGAIAVYEYLQASLDENCGYTNDVSCANYNYLKNILKNSWTITGDTARSDKAYNISAVPKLSSCSSYSGVNVTFNISDKVIYADGDGTKENPYTIR